MGAILLTGSRIGEGAIIAAGTLVLEGQEIPVGNCPQWVSPQKVRREVTEEETQTRPTWERMITSYVVES